MEQENGAGQSNQAPQGAAPVANMDPKQKNLLAGILAYLSILVIVAYVLGKDDPFTKFHVKQGIVLFVLEVVAMVVLSMMPYFMMMNMLHTIINLAFLALSIIGIVNVVQGHEKELPVIGGLGKNVPI